MSEFSLDAVINEAIEDSGLADPHEVAALITIPAEHQEQVLRQVLPNYVSDAMRKARRRAMTDTGLAEEETSTPRIGRSRWAKFTPALLDASVSVGGERKLLGDCSVADLEAIADEYRQRSEQMVEYSRKFDDLAKRLRLSGAATLREATATGPVRVAA